MIKKGKDRKKEDKVYKRCDLGGLEVLAEQPSTLVTGSQDHSGWKGWMLRRSQPNLLLTALRSDLVAEGFVQSGLENLQGLPKTGCLNHINCLTHMASQPCCHGLDGDWRQWGACPPKQQVVPGDTLSMDLLYQSCTLWHCNPPKLCLVCPGWLSESSLSFLLCLTPLSEHLMDTRTGQGLASGE